MSALPSQVNYNEPLLRLPETQQISSLRLYRPTARLLVLEVSLKQIYKLTEAFQILLLFQSDTKQQSRAQTEHKRNSQEHRLIHLLINMFVMLILKQLKQYQIITLSLTYLLTLNFLLLKNQVNNTVSDILQRIPSIPLIMKTLTEEFALRQVIHFM